MEIKHRACETHCCILHGCKYGYDDCPVVLGEVKQQYLCEDCSDEINFSYSGKVYTSHDFKMLINDDFIIKNRKLKINKIRKKYHNIKNY